MSEKTRALVKVILAVLFFCLGVALTIVGRITYGWLGLGIMFVGLIILLTLLFLYNKRYR